jgi:peroxiredoxin
VKYSIRIYMVVALLLVVCKTLIAETRNQTLPELTEPFYAPNFSLQGEEGKTYRLKDYRGKVVILNFWATWCPPCREEMPSMERAWKKVKDDNDIAILAINVGEDADTIFEFMGHYPVTFPLLMDIDGNVVKQYPVRGLPTTYIIDPAGTVTHRAVGSREWDAPVLLQQLKDLKSKN